MLVLFLFHLLVRGCKERKQPQNRGTELAANIIEAGSSKPSAWEVDEAQIANVPDEYRRFKTVAEIKRS